MPPVCLDIWVWLSPDYPLSDDSPKTLSWLYSFGDQMATYSVLTHQTSLCTKGYQTKRKRRKIGKVGRDPHSWLGFTDLLPPELCLGRCSVPAFAGDLLCFRQEKCFLFHVAMWLQIYLVWHRLYLSWHWPDLKEAHVLGRQDCCLSRLEDDGWWQGQAVPWEEVKGEQPCPRLHNKAGQVMRICFPGSR